jgi:6-phosphogluconate dehydrogenase (decarboxylating)
LDWASAKGSGYYVKLVHNCIEFCMNQAIVDGVELLRHGGYDLDIQTSVLLYPMLPVHHLRGPAISASA